jgi:hypothetical protein
MSPWMLHVQSCLYGLALNRNLGYIRKYEYVTPSTKGFLLSIQQRSLSQASFTDSVMCDSDFPPAETEGKPLTCARTDDSKFAVLCNGLFLLLGRQIVPTKIAVNVSNYISFKFIVKSKAKLLVSAFPYSPKTVQMTMYPVEDNLC